METIIKLFTSLRKYCEKQNYKGYDVSDSIATPILTKTFLNWVPLVRFFFMQLTGHRLAYINIRPLLFIPKFHNAKGIALFLNGYCNLYELIDSEINVGMTKDFCIEKIRYLASLLLSLQAGDYSGAGWGYPTGWQGRTIFYFPPNTPTVVATSFAVEALFHAYTITSNSIYKEQALSSAKFVLNDLQRINAINGFLLSYAPIPGNDQVFNASLLGAKILSQCYEFSKNKEYLSIAKQIIQTVINYQSADGSWQYGLGRTQGWIDNFHTGYNLEAIQTYQDISMDFSFKENIAKGLQFMLSNHFEKDFTPKYYHNKKYPIDIHCCGELFVVLHKLKQFSCNKNLADGVLEWTFHNMWNKEKGYFYFQKNRFITNKTPLMRWSQAFMFNALTYYLKSKNNIE